LRVLTDFLQTKSNSNSINSAVPGKAGASSPSVGIAAPSGANRTATGLPAAKPAELGQLVALIFNWIGNEMKDKLLARRDQELEVPRLAVPPGRQLP